MSMDDFSQRVGIREDTEQLLKAAKKYAEFQEEDRDLSGDYFRAGNGTFSNDKVIRVALKGYVPDRFIDEVKKR